jgi:hypothetical protein
MPMIDNNSLLTYGSIGLTAIILAVATIYDHDSENAPENISNETESKTDLGKFTSNDEKNSQNSQNSQNSENTSSILPQLSPSPTQSEESVGGKTITKRRKRRKTKRNRRS